MFPVLAPPAKDTAFPEFAGHKSPISYVPSSAASPRGCLGKEDLPKDTAAPKLAGRKSEVPERLLTPFDVSSSCTATVEATRRTCVSSVQKIKKMRF